MFALLVGVAIGVALLAQAVRSREGSGTLVR
jgi:hypothetical protein